MVKENNVTSEQTFLVSIQVTDSAPTGTSIQPATLGADYSLAMNGQTSVTETFFAFEQRVAFQFTLFPDSLPEGTEAFQASVSPEDTRMRPDGTVEMFPTFLRSETLASEIFVNIQDDDCMFQKQLLCHNFCVLVYSLLLCMQLL